MITRVAILSIFVCIPFISHAVEEYPLKDMDLTFTIREDLNEEEAEFLSIGGYVESRNQLRVKEMDEPISLRQRLWLDCYLGQDWIRGLPLFRFRQRAASCLLVFILSSRYQDIVLIYLQRVSITLSLR